MKITYSLGIVLFCAASIFCAAEDSHVLEKSIQATIQAFQNHDHDFADKTKSVIPSIFEIATAELHVALGSLNVSVTVQESFIELHEELSNYSELFSKAMKEMDAQDGTVINLRRCVDAIKEVMLKRKAFLEADEEESANLATQFERAFEDQVIIISDVLFDNVHNKFNPKKGLFEKFAAKSYQHPVQTKEFIHGCLQIMAQLTILEATHVELTLNSEDASAAFRRKVEKRWNKVLNLAAKIINRQQSRSVMLAQIEADQKRFHEEWKSLSHCDFANQAKIYLAAKYPKYKFFVISYNPVIGGDNHFMSQCVPSFKLFKYHKRNSVISLFPSYSSAADFFNWARNILDKVPKKTRVDHDRAWSVLREIQKHSGKCRFGLIFVVTMRASVCYSGPLGFSVETVKTAEVCNTGLCWIKHHYPQRVIVAGRANL